MLFLANDSTFWHTFIFYGKIAGATVSFITIAGIIFGFIYKKLIKPAVGKIVHINDTITKLDTNCIPTLQRSLDNQDRVLDGLKKGHEEFKTQIAIVAARQSNFETSLSTIHQDLMNHLESTSKEKQEKRKKVKV
jgi:hypothetical protein